jgi:hypothetical protein
MSKSEVKVKMGLGEAMVRANKLQARIQSSYASQAERSEYEMIMEALNNIQIDVGFDCDDDGVPDSVDIFEASASTSCCRPISIHKSSSSKSKMGKIKNGKVR